MVICEVLHINSSYKYVQKVKLNLNDNPNIFFEIIELQEKGEKGAEEVFRLKFLTDPITLELQHSAMGNCFCQNIA